MSELTNDKVTKLLKIYLGSEPVDFDKPTLMVSYQVIPSERGKLVREEVRVINTSDEIRIRYYGKTPIVFIKSGDVKNLEVLNLANLVKVTLEDETRVSIERNIKFVIQNVLKGRNVLLKKNVFYGVMGDVMLKRPHKDYVAYSNIMFKTAAEIVVSETKEKVVNGNGGNA